MFRSTTIIRELSLSLAKVTFMKIGKSTSLWTMRLCGSMLYQVHGGVCAVCCAESRP
jgi:hypothetical protein